MEKKFLLCHSRDNIIEQEPIMFKRSHPMAEGATMGQNEKNEKESISNFSQLAVRNKKSSHCFFLS